MRCYHDWVLVITTETCRRRHQRYIEPIVVCRKCGWHGWLDKYNQTIYDRNDIQTWEAELLYMKRMRLAYDKNGVDGP